MSITGVTEQHYRDFLSEGGSLTFEIDAIDIDSSGQFEKSPLIAPFLSSGFELKPTPIIENPKDSCRLLLYGDSWTRVITYAYKKGGSVIYKKLLSGRYEAKVSVPNAR